MRKPKLYELREAIAALIVGPYTSPFPNGPSPIAEEFRGKPVYHEEDCIGCGACSEVCPAHAIEVTEGYRRDGIYKVLTVHLDVCVYCGTCVEKCTTKKGITQSREYDLSVFDRADAVEKVEKKMVVCELCNEPFATRDHLNWIYQKIGTIAASNWTLMLVGSEALDVIDKTAVRDERKVGRHDNMRILCPDCRRKVMLTEEWGANE